MDFERLWANPHWPMWYLAAIFFWRLMAPAFRRLPGKVVVAVAISLLAGLYANDILDNARIFGLLPFFVLGLKMHEGHWMLLRARRARWPLSLVLVTVVAVALAVLLAWRPAASRLNVLGDLPVGSAKVAEARTAAGYLGKYVTKSFERPRPSGLKRYDVAEGYAPKAQLIVGRARRPHRRAQPTPGSSEE